MASSTISLRDTTLREGIQMPGVRISPEQQLEFVRLLDRAGAPEIEIGLPDGVRACSGLADAIKEAGLSIRSSGLIPIYTNRWKEQIDQAALHKIDRIDLLIPTSDFLLADTFLYGMVAKEILPKLEAASEYASRSSMEIGVGLMDATRTRPDRLEAILTQLSSFGANRVVIYDSVGIMQPSAMKILIQKVRAAANIPVLVHCHNDYGMATANSLAAVEAGAEAVDVALNGVGGRAGNAALEEVALALKNLYQKETGIDTRLLPRLSAMTEELTGVQVAATKPIVGENCFSHLPVMHIRCIAAGNPSTFEPYPPEQVGRERKYFFSLPVDYRAALEPFLQKSRRSLDEEEHEKLVNILQAGEGFTESELLELIRSMRSQVLS